MPSNRLVGNPFAGLVANQGDGNNPQQGVENRDPLPNPWAPPTAQTPNSTGASSTTGAANRTGTGANPLGGGMEQLMQQMLQNQGGMQGLLNSPLFEIGRASCRERV